MKTLNGYEIVDEHARKKISDLEDVVNTVGSELRAQLIAEGTIDEYTGSNFEVVMLCEIPLGNDGIYEVMVSAQLSSGDSYSVYAKGRLNDERKLYGTNFILHDGGSYPVYLEIDGGQYGNGSNHMQRIYFKAFMIANSFESSAIRDLKLSNIKYAVYKINGYPEQ